MPRLFGGLVDVCYGQFYLVHGGEEGVDMLAAFRGQANGLCGASVPGILNLMASTHTGSVALTIDAHEHAPALDDAWEEIVEAPFHATGETLVLVEMMSETTRNLPLAPGEYRVRYCAFAMDNGGDADTLQPGEAAPDRYHLDLWRASPAKDEVIKQTSQAAAYWHRWAKRPDQNVA